MKKKILLSVILAVIMGFNMQQEKIKIVCFGDSITHGAGVEGRGWVEKLSARFDNITFVNAGRNGRKTSDLDELQPVIDGNRDADYFIILLGVNDLKNGNDSLVANCVSNVDSMLSQIKSEIPSAKVIIASPCNINLETMSEINRKKLYNEATQSSLIKLNEEYKKLAERRSAGFIQLYGKVCPENFWDGLHPNEKGHEEIADAVAEFISAMIK
ncbi:lipolytic protein G-D-S-L family [Melioribacter roseus P3M-2]|uniref:Lipolytic protein G-D-S-L family n=1 Tax=Melioribacter roseus (strain DSM 23840 / JCM 17771 / VKM B-2668 / P3M-2) TaxID=1191523 RepID=I7A0F6_MELRP|nr:SGNH/GDSL hydrolase family protein [Melioribacter roseus]AFN74743.1 lipolytic protein G-D-S-L family [Melioribacter roseus P3M-2]